MPAPVPPPGGSDSPEGLSAPLGFALSFIEGRALLGFEARRLTDWLTLRDFTMELPGVRFPFDVSGGAEKFRNRRCRLTGLTLEVDEAGFLAWLAERLRPRDHGLGPLTLAFGQGGLEVAGTVAAGDVDPAGNPRPGAPVPFSAQLGVDAERERAIRLVLHDLRLYRRSALPAPAVGLALLHLAGAADLPVAVGLPQTLTLDPVPTLLKALLPRHGWKLPALDDVRLTEVGVGPGLARFTFGVGAGQEVRGGRSFLAALEGSRAFAQAEAAVAEGDWPQARAAWAQAAGPVPEHPFAAERLLSLWSADPAHRADAADLADTLLARHPDFAPALWTRALLGPEAGREAASAFLTLAEAAQAAGTPLAARLAAETAAARAEAAAEPALAAQAWELARRLGSGPAGAALIPLYQRLGDPGAAAREAERRLAEAPPADKAALHRVLGRLHAGLPGEAPAAPEQQAAWAAHRAPTPLSIDRARARLHFDAAVREAPEVPEGWWGLGLAAAQEEPLRAVRALDRAREGLQARGDRPAAAEVARAVARLWEAPLDHPENALLRWREVLAARPDDGEAWEAVGRLCLGLGRLEEAEAAFESALGHLSDDDPARRRTLHARLAEVARGRDDRRREAAHLEAALDPEGPPEVRQERLRRLVAALEAVGEGARRADALLALVDAGLPAEEGAEALATSARLLLEAGGDPEEARRRLGRARQLDPQGLGPLEALVALEDARGPSEAQAAALEALARRRPQPEGRARAWLALGSLREGQGEIEGALAAYAAAAAEGPDALGRRAAEARLALARRTDRGPALAEALAALAARLDPEAAVGLRLDEARVRADRLDDPEGAVAALSAARAAAPEDPRVLWALGQALLAAGRPQAAHPVLVDLLARGGPQAVGCAEAEAAAVLGRAALGAGERETAASWLTRALDHAPGDAGLWATLDPLLLSLDRPEEWARAARKVAAARAAEGAPDDAAPLELAAARRLTDLDPEAALAAALAALDRLAPEGVVVAALEARAGGQAPGRPGVAGREAAEGVLALARRVGAPEALARGAAAAVAAGGPVDALVEAGEAWWAAGRADEGRRLLERALQLAPDDAPLRVRLAERLADDAPREALAHYERLLARPPQVGLGALADWRRRAAALAEACGEAGRARHHLGTYLALRPDDRSALTAYVAALRQAEAWEPLHDALVQAAAQAPEAEARVTGFLEAADLAVHRLGRPRVARAHLERILEEQPEHPEATQRLVALLGDAEPLRRVDLHRRLAAWAPTPEARAPHHLAVAEALQTLGRADEARQAAEAAGADAPASSAAAELLASLAWERGDLPALGAAGARAARLAADAGAPEAAMRLLVMARLHQDELGAPEAARALLDRALDLPDGLVGEARREALTRRLAQLPADDLSGREADLSALLALPGTPPGEQARLRQARAGVREETDPEGAREDWLVAHRLAPEDPAPLGRLLALAEAADDRPAGRLLWQAEAERRRRAGDPEGAGEAWARVAELAGNQDPRLAARSFEAAAALAPVGPLRTRRLTAWRRWLAETGQVAQACRLDLALADALPPADAAQKLLAGADEARRAGLPGVAVALLRRAVGRAPAHLEGVAALVEALWLLGGTREAAPLARRLLDTPTAALARALDRGEAEARHLRLTAARVLAEGDPEAAWSAVLALAEEAPASAPVADTLAALADATGQPAAALPALEAHRRSVAHPARRRALAARLADRCQAAGRFEDAARWLEAVGPLTPGRRRRQLALWARAGAAGAFRDAALAWLAADAPPELAEGLALADRLAGPLADPEGALEVLANLERQHPEHPAVAEATLAPARAAGAAEAEVAALEALVRAAGEETDPAAAAARRARLGTRLVALGQGPAAEAALLAAGEEALAAGHPAAAEAAWELAWMRLGSETAADRLEALRADGDDPAALARLLQHRAERCAGLDRVVALQRAARAWQVAGDRASARACLDEASRLAPADRETLSVRLSMAESAEARAAALEHHLDHLPSDDPQRPDRLRELARAWTEADRPDAAVAAWEALLAHRPEDAEALSEGGRLAGGPAAARPFDERRVALAEAEGRGHDPALAAVRHRLGLATLEADQPRLALPLLEAAVAGGAPAGAALVRAAVVLGVPEAEARGHEAVAGGRGDARDAAGAWVAAAACWQRAGDSERALAAWQTALSRHLEAALAALPVTAPDLPSETALCFSLRALDEAHLHAPAHGAELAERAAAAAEALPHLPEGVGPALAAALASLPLPDAPEARARRLELLARTESGGRQLEALLGAADAWEAAADAGEAARVLGQAQGLAPDAPEVLARTCRQAVSARDLEAVEVAATRWGRVLGSPPPEVLALARAALAEAHPALAEALLRGQPTQEPAVDDLRAEALFALDRPGEALDALTRAREAAAAQGATAEAQVTRLRALARATRDRLAPAEAVPAWRAVLEAHPADEEAFLALEAVYQGAAAPLELAALYLARARVLASAGDLDASVLLALNAARAATQGGDPEATRQAWTLALLWQPGSPEALAGLRDRARQDEDPAAERALLTEALHAAAPGRPRAEAAQELARFEGDRGDADAGLAAWRLAVEALGADDPAGWPAWARALLREAAEILVPGALAAGDPEAAFQLAERAEAAGADPGTFAAQLAVARQTEGDATGALAGWRQAAEAAPDDPEVWAALARAAEAAEDPDTELAALAQVAALRAPGSEQAGAWHTLAQRAQALGRAEASADALARAAEADPAREDVFAPALAARLTAGDEVGARHLWQRRAAALSRPEAQARAWCEAGWLALRLGDPEAAVADLQRAVAQDPAADGALEGLGHALEAAGRDPEAAEVWRQWLDQGGPTGLIRHQLGRIAWRLGDREAAQAEIHAALHQDPNRQAAWADAVALAQGAGDAAVESWALEGLLACTPAEAEAERATVARRLGELARRRLHTDEALARYREALVVEPDEPATLEALAELEAERGHYREAAGLLARRVEVAPGPESAPARLRLARLLADRLGDADGALPLAAEATRLAPDDPEAWRLRLELAAPREDAETVVTCAARLEALDSAELALPFALEIGEALRTGGDPLGAARWLLRGAEHHPLDRALLGEAVAALVAAGQADVAAAHLEALARRTGDPADRRAAAEAALLAGDVGAWAEGMSVEDPTLDPGTRSRLLRSVAEAFGDTLGRPQRAAEILAAAPGPEGDEGYLADTARWLEAAGEVAQAREHWLGLVRRDPTRREALDGLGRLDPGPWGAQARVLSAWLAGAPTPAPQAPSEVPELERLLPQVAVPPAEGPVARFLAALAPALEPLFPADLARFGADAAAPLPPEHPLVARLERWRAALGGRPMSVYLGERLGFEAWIENTRPLAWIVGPELADAAPALQDQAAVRAVVLGRLGYALPGRFSEQDVQTLVRLGLSFFNSAVPVPIPADKLSRYHVAIGRQVDAERRERLAALAAGAATGLAELDAAHLTEGLRRTADRVALTVTGDLAAGIEAVLRLERRWTRVGESRVEQLRAHPALLGLVGFAFSEAAPPVPDPVEPA